MRIAAIPYPDRRYWRRRANRQVRKARLTRSAVRFAIALSIDLALLALLVVASARIGAHFVDSGEFSLERIELEGVNRLPPERIRERLRPFVNHSLLGLDLEQVAAASALDPGVRSASAKRVLPDTVRVSLVEREPRAIALIGGIAHVVDGTGFVIGPTGPEGADNLPILSGLGDYAGDSLVAALRRGVDAVQRLEHAVPQWMAEISEIDLARPDRLEVRTVEAGPVIALDPVEVERNLALYLELRTEIAERAGEADYVDLRFRGRIAVLPVPGTSGKEAG
jgi:cell division protein FtsQ